MLTHDDFEFNFRFALSFVSCYLTKYQVLVGYHKQILNSDIARK